MLGSARYARYAWESCYSYTELQRILTIIVHVMKLRKTFAENYAMRYGAHYEAFRAAA